MATVICMLRGVNLASHNRMKMDALCELFPALACENARTYIQSGNVVFKTRERQLPKLAAGIEAAIQRKFAFRPAAILRTLAELREVVKQNPFAKRRSIEPNKLLVTFLAAEPAAEGRAKLLGIEAAPEEIHLRGREIYIYYPNGMARPKVPWSKVEKVLQVPGTGRNWNTVTKLLEMAEEMNES